MKTIGLYVLVLAERSTKASVNERMPRAQSN